MNVGEAMGKAMLEMLRSSVRRFFDQIGFSKNPFGVL